MVELYEILDFRGHNTKLLIIDVSHGMVHPWHVSQEL
jgi:hypothetical protein